MVTAVARPPLPSVCKELPNLGDRVLISHDVGPVHTGYAVFATNESGYTGCVLAEEIKPMEGYLRLQRILELNAVAIVVVENFRLDAKKMKAQIGRAMYTSEQIGGIQLLVDMHNLYALESEFVTFHREEPSSKDATRGHLRTYGIRRKALGNGEHAENAELHGWKWLFQARDRGLIRV